MGLTASHPDSYLGSAADACAFWFDDGDAYHSGDRFHAGKMKTRIVVGPGDLAAWQERGFKAMRCLNKALLGLDCMSGLLVRSFQAVIKPQACLAKRPSAQI